jgi:hypothetical protein
MCYIGAEGRGLQSHPSRGKSPRPYLKINSSKMHWGAVEAVAHRLSKCKVQSQCYQKKNKVKLSYNPAIPLLFIHLKK